MAHWILSVLQNNGFVNPTRFPLLCQKPGALAIVELGHTTGRQFGRRKCCKARNFELCIFDF